MTMRMMRQGMTGQMGMGPGMMGMGADPLLYGSPRLASGEIAEAPDDSITVEIVTTDGSLVRKLAFDRCPGRGRQLTE